MLSYTPTDQKVDIPIYGVSDLVKGDLGSTAGAANTPLKAIADNISNIYGLLNRYNGDLLKTNSYSFDASNDVGKFFIFNISDNKTFTLPAASLLKAGTVIPVKCKTAGIKTLTINSATSSIVLGAADARNTIYLHDSETVYIMAATNGSSPTPNHYELIGDYSFLLNVGHSIGGRILFDGYVLNAGGFLNRQDNARLFEWVSTKLAWGQTYMSYSVWVTNINYQGCFNDGDGVSTFGLPDERGMHDRYLDLSRGIDNGRLHNFAGGYEPDDILKHNHSLRTTNSGININDNADPIRGTIPGSANTQGGVGTGKSIGETGIEENRVKNIGKIGQTKY